ncbi:nucleotide 5'-monophosphate nucleosidase PpnN [Cocleimonas sp. KMM 6892]|uniref:nucleotide 5'-monophosphate nucleosidase PpnN n=1 Tax=unclassified Cocleimonas TaxID=2639732 RepID=UPI002DBA464C|nr:MULTISPECIES: nucleotide 5'-monophosphate nucleosidase PpnN [unclassified Cocleimonas]MEB8431832.1 nucleotide 5'-monophosphate nucleosidase PpnN [Cocleimonas sp. KMM 6892]MEC4715082.1 nucleotide 5'-monophosphate nucleosidase PpnN [Cocleimonas sp. KMM 6895]MEC4744104.1 nucleotide 5'-monophosphate nucleosidase PpnN [Cocleimonas sp. KMM 6896]
MSEQLVSARITPTQHLNILSQLEVSRLLDASNTGIYRLFRQCALAVLTHGNYTDDAKELLERHKAFEIRIIQQDRGIKLEVKGAPAEAFVDGRMIQGINEHLFAVMRDILYTHDEILDNPKFDLEDSDGITNAVFHIMRNSGNLRPRSRPQLVVCWGGHSISRMEYDYTKEIGYQLGLRGMDICTGCGPGAMKGPMKGAAYGHAKQRIKDGQYLGITEPGIIAAESPNPIVNDLVILPDIEKRLEAFVRTGHAIVVFPGGAGTTEEILYILGILLHPDNETMPFPLIFSAPEGSRDYFQKIDDFIGATLGKKAQEQYEIIIDNPEKVAKKIKKGTKRVRDFRRQHSDAYYYNWRLKIDTEFQQTFIPTHENMANLELSKDLETHVLAANLRRAFSGIVAGNVKDEGIRAIEKHGLFQLSGDPDIMQKMDDLLKSFIKNDRMKLPSDVAYTPCYEIVK